MERWDGGNLVSRRAFVAGGTAALLTAGCSTVPSRPLRGGVPTDLRLGERLAFEPLEIAVGAASPFRVLHVSDSHLTGMTASDLVSADEGRLWLYERRKNQFPDANWNFAAMLSWVRRERVTLFHTGDLVDYPSQANVAAVRDGLVGLDSVVAPGNHEYNWHQAARPANADVSKVREFIEPHYPNRFELFERQMNGVTFVAFDNAHYNVSERQVCAIERILDRGKPTVFLCHIPFYTPELCALERAQRSAWDLWRYGGGRLAHLMGCPDEVVAEYPEDRRLEQGASSVTRAFVERCRRRRNLKAILCGHLHRAWAGPFSEYARQYVVGPLFRGEGYDIHFT